MEASSLATSRTIELSSRRPFVCLWQPGSQVGARSGALEQAGHSTESNRDIGVTHGLGIQVTKFQYLNTAIVHAMSHEQPHHNVALEHFLPAGPLAVFPVGPELAMLYLTDPE